MTRASITITTEIDLDIEIAAKWFAELTDDEMCKFLVAVEAESQKWPRPADDMWYYLGGHLRNCPCSNDGTRDMLRSWVRYMEHSRHGGTP